MWTGTFPATRAGRDSGDRSGWWAHWKFTSRAGGVSSTPYESLNLADHVGDDREAVAINRRRLASSLAETAGAKTTLAIMGAAHGADVGVITTDPKSVAQGVDALVTGVPDIAVTALAADCVPIVLADVDAKIAAAIHCGWPGLVAGVVAAAAKQMIELGASASNISAVAGPAICGHCYGVSDERYDRVVDVVQAAAATSATGGRAVDVRAGVLSQLADCGITATTVGGCTFTDPRLFSYRRDAITGRHAGSIVLRAA